MLTRILERHAPSALLVELAVGVGTLIGGLEFAAFFILGVVILAMGQWLDGYGIPRT